MLKVSALKVEFGKSDTIKSIKLQNIHQNNVIFKVKVTKFNGKTSIDVEPNRGFIRAGSSVSFIIKSMSNQKFQAKVLFTYSMVSDKPLEFIHQWERCKQKNSFQHKIIQIKRIENLQQQQKLNLEQKSNQKTNNRLNNLKIFSKQKKSSSLDAKKNLFDRKKEGSNSPIKQFKVSRMKSKEEFEKEEFIEQISIQKRIYSTQEMQEVIDDLHQVQRLYQHQKVQNTKLTQQLSITEYRLKQVTQDRMHIKIHKSIGIICQEYHTTFTTLLILGLFCFILGFFLGQIQAQIV